MTVQISDSFIYKKQKVTLIAQENFPLYDPTEHGYKPQSLSSACWRGYVCEYEVGRGRLYLKHLSINDEIKGSMYERLDYPLDYTGKILIANSREGVYVSTGFQEGYGFENVIELTFENGNLKCTKDYSERALAVRGFIERDADAFFNLKHKDEDPVLRYMDYIMSSFSTSYAAKAWWLDDERLDELIGKIPPVVIDYDPEKDPEMNDPYFLPEKAGRTIVSKISKDSMICGHCKFAKNEHGEGWRCNNPKIDFWDRQKIGYAFEACDKFERFENKPPIKKEKTKEDEEREKLISEIVEKSRAEGRRLTIVEVMDAVKEAEDKEKEKQNENEIEAEVEVITEDNGADRKIDVVEETEQISKGIVIASKDVRYEDGKNVISVIINAISVTINISGEYFIKAIKWLFRNLSDIIPMLFGIFVIIIMIQSCTEDKTVTTGSKDYPGTEISEESSEAVAEARDVAISENYSYTLPAGSVREESYVGSAFANERAYSFLNESEDYCVVRSYITDKRYDDLREEIAGMIEPIVDIVNVQYENESYDFGDVLLCSYETVSAEDKKIRVMMYSWYDDSAICFLEVSSAYDTLESTAQSLMATVHNSHNSISNADLLKAANSVQISSHYFYKMPEGTLGVYDPEEVLAEREQFLEFKQDGDIYTVRSYVLDYSGTGLTEIVKASLSQFDGISFVSEETIEGKYTDVHVIKFEVDNDDGTTDKVTGFYWSEIDPKICCLEVIADERGDGKVEQMVMDSVYRITDSSDGAGTDSGQQSGLSPSDMQKAYDDARMEEYQDQIVEDYYNDQIKDYYENEPRGLPY